MYMILNLGVAKKVLVLKPIVNLFISFLTFVSSQGDDYYLIDTVF